MPTPDSPSPADSAHHPLAGSDEVDRSPSDASAASPRPDDSSVARDDVVRSPSGAVLGQPDAEYGAYGMVKDQSGGPTPSREERRIRGLGPGEPGTPPGKERD